MTTSLLTTLLSLLKSIRTVLNLSISILSFSAFRQAKSDFATNLDLSTLLDSLNQILLQNVVNQL